MNIIPGDQMAPLKAPLSSSKEIYSSRGCMCQISLAAALATAESSPSDVRVLESMTITLFCCVGDIKQCPLSTEKQIGGTGFTARLCSLRCLLGRMFGPLMLQPCVPASCDPARKHLCKIFTWATACRCFEMTVKTRWVITWHSKPWNKEPQTPGSCQPPQSGAGHLNQNNSSGSYCDVWFITSCEQWFVYFGQTG